MGTHPIFESDFDCLTDMDRVGHIKNGNRSRSQSSREVRNKTQSSTIEMAALILAAGDFDESNLSTIGSANKRGNSKALLSVGNKPQLFHSIGMLEGAGFEKSQIFVAIEPDDLVQYEENERIVPVESRIPQANMLLVEEPKSSADTLAEVGNTKSDSFYMDVLGSIQIIPSL